MATKSSIQANTLISTEEVRGDYRSSSVYSSRPVGEQRDETIPSGIELDKKTPKTDLR